ncbi:hypothetical protein ACROYT_G032481 [Oculina patagonica]
MNISDFGPQDTGTYQCKAINKLGSISALTTLNYVHQQGFNAVFTNLGASGRYAPTSLGIHYTCQDHDGQVALSSGIQQWSVPYTGDYRIEAIGAAGGYDTQTNSAQYRGRGARMIGTFSLSKGEIIKILVGQEGGFNTDSQTAGGGGGGGGGGGFLSNGRSSQRDFGGSMGKGGEGGKGFLQGGVGGRAVWYNVFGGFGGGASGSGKEVEVEEDTLVEAVERINMSPVGEGEGLTTSEKISKMNAAIKRPVMVR